MVLDWMQDVIFHSSKNDWRTFLMIDKRRKGSPAELTLFKMSLLIIVVTE